MAPKLKELGYLFCRDLGPKGNASFPQKHHLISLLLCCLREFQSPQEDNYGPVNMELIKDVSKNLEVFCGIV